MGQALFMGGSEAAGTARPAVRTGPALLGKNRLCPAAACTGAGRGNRAAPGRLAARAVRRLLSRCAAGGTGAQFEPPTAEEQKSPASFLVRRGLFVGMYGGGSASGIKEGGQCRGNAVDGHGL